ncbi:MAG: hypothetical protein HFJ30_06170 [Clostridia bacterium]|jgi:hypothetical protein|nr:hypothetical protein [Clostridia bacterium]MCI9413087.1 hypothetical protein [Clostridia bacterium]
MGEFWETMKGAWRLHMHGTLSDHMRANRDIMMGKNPYTGKPHLQENTSTRIKRLERYSCTVSTPRTSDVVKYELDLLQKQSQTATPSEFDAICEKYNALKREYEALKAEETRKQMQQNKDEKTQ